MLIPDLNSLSRTPYIFLILGVISTCAGVVWTCTGKAWDRGIGWVCRAQEPKVFWGEVVTYYLIGIIFIGTFMHEVYGRSH